MPNTNRLQVIPGLSFPFFPMRPTPGPSLLTKEAVAQVVDYIRRDQFVVQRKRNGDRVIMAKINGKVYWANRHGSFYNYDIANKALFNNLPDTTVLDGEVRDKTFSPFEGLVLGGKSYLLDGPDIREMVARKVCSDLNDNWAYEVSEIWMLDFEKNWPVEEGVVIKRVGSRYLPLGSDNQNSPTWFKLKWR